MRFAVVILGQRIHLRAEMGYGVPRRLRGSSRPIDTASPSPAKSLLMPDNHVLILIDLQSQMAFATRSISPELPRNNAVLVANAAASFNVPTILSTVAESEITLPCRAPRLAGASAPASSGTNADRVRQGRTQLTNQVRNTPSSGIS